MRSTQAIKAEEAQIKDQADKLYEAAWLHYECGLSQKEVAGRLGVDKATVSRWIRDARKRNIVSVSVTPPGLSGLEMRLRQTFGLTRVRVIPSLPVPEDSSCKPADSRHSATREGQRTEDARESPVGGGPVDLQYEELGKAAARFVGLSLKGGIGVGLGGGRAVAAFAHHLFHHCPMVGLDFFALAVSSREPFATCATSVTAMCTSLVASEFRQRATRAASPNVMRAPRVTGHALRLPERGGDFKAMAKAADDYYEVAMRDVELIVTSVGAIETCWVLDERERDRLARDMGAVGDILYDIYGEGGTPIKVEPTAAVFPFTISRLQHMVSDGREVIIISSGKTAATYHALACKQKPFVTGVVTDERTACGILDFSERMIG